MRIALARQCQLHLSKKAFRQKKVQSYNKFSVVVPLRNVIRARNDFRHPYRDLTSSSQILDAAQETRNVETGEDTIYALSSAPGRAAIAVIRVSGPSCVEIYHALCPGKALPQPRLASVRTLYEPARSPTIETVLDSSALIVYFPSPRTVTGEDVIELHVHGGLAIVKAVLAAIPKCTSKQNSIRYAEPGEFTRRAFLNNRLDLTQVEALGDTLSAATEKQRKLSIRGTSGRLAKQYEAWRTQLLYARGELEALIDFSEDQHFDESPAVLASSVAAQVSVLSQHVRTHITNAVRGELLRNGVSIALLGAPNAGKSSLLNRIVGREAAIVSREAGTTRDVVEVGIDLGGYLCRVGDMAGLRRNEPNGERSERIGIVEEEGIKRAKQRAVESDVVILVLPVEERNGLTSFNADQEVIDAAIACAERGSQIIAVINKIDLIPSDQQSFLKRAKDLLLKQLPALDQELVFAISCKEPPTLSSSVSSSANSGIETLLNGLIKTFEAMTCAVTPDSDSLSDPSIFQESLGASERHRLLLESSLGYLEAFLSQVEIDDSKPEEELDVVIAAESLHAAANCLARITGRGSAGDVEEVLGVVFEKFCVGK